jgi:xanthine dehydrogenase YagS FAD-binding subunit
MQPFLLSRSSTPEDATRILAAAGTTSPIAGGTTLLDLMKLDVMRPERLIDINAALSNQITEMKSGLRIGAMVRMAEAARHERIIRDYPIVAQSLLLAASAQIRNMASLGGNVLQRTRCGYFRDSTVPNCNKRSSGSGCAAFDGVNRMHAVLGGSEKCIATYGGDFAQALIAVNAQVEIIGNSGPRTISFSELHVLPGENPAIETTLRPDELIAAFILPAAPWFRRSLYLKIRDRDSYAYALSSVALALDLDGDRVREVRIGLGGVATVPWRAKAAEAYLTGKVLDEGSAKAAGTAAFADAQTRDHNSYKPVLGAQTIARALMSAKSLEIEV